MVKIDIMHKNMPAPILNAVQLKWLSLTVIIIVFDLVTKAYFSSSMELYQTIVVFKDLFNLNFSFTLVHNHGAAFSFLSDQGGWQRWFFTITSSVISIVLLVWLFRLKKSETLIAVALTLVLGGAIGNLYDRVTLGYVVDFLDVFIQTPNFEQHWPAFNIADSAISIGAILLIVDAFTSTKKEN